MKKPMFDTSRWEKALNEEYERREAERRRELEKSKKALKEYFKKRRLAKAYLVGSILEEGKFYSFSDIDIAVEGLQEDYFKTLSGLEALLDRGVDLIELENCRFREPLEQRGVKIV